MMRKVGAVSPRPFLLAPLRNDDLHLVMGSRCFEVRRCAKLRTFI